MTPSPTPRSSRERESPPDALVVDGQYRYGTYNGPIRVINPLDSVGGPRWSRGPRRALRNVRMKEWEAFQLGNDDWFVLGAVYTAKVVALLQVIAVHKRSGLIHRWERKVLPWTVSVAAGLGDSRSHGRSGNFEIAIGNQLDRSRVTIDATHPGSADESLPSLELHGVGTLAGGRGDSLVICHPFGAGRALYSHKAMMAFSGLLSVGGEPIDLDGDRSFLVLDDHHGDYPSPMVYDWVTAATRQPDGTILGFNLTANQVQDPERFNENALWIGGHVLRLPAVKFARPDGVHAPWHVTSVDGEVDVTFTPSVRSEMHVGPRRLLAEYFAPYGRFSGSITTADGRGHEVDGLFGVGEQKRILL